MQQTSPAVCSAGGAGLSVHHILGRADLVDMPGKPVECKETEGSVVHRDGDTYIVTFPKTGTTLLSFICHLLRSPESNIDSLTDFNDICEVVPHTSSAWFIGQDVNATQPGNCRLFKSHRMLRQVGSWAAGCGLRYIATIRRPSATLLSLHAYRVARGRFGDSDPDIMSYARSAAWQDEHMKGCIPSIWDCCISYWNCRNAHDFLLIPYESLCEQKEKWLQIIAIFLSTPLSAQKRAAILSVTSKEWMLEHVSKFDESWVAGMRLMTGRAHPSIAREAPKVRTDKEANVDNVDSGRIDEAFEAYNAQIWADRVMPITGHARYIDMANDICSKHNLPPLLD